MTRLPIEICLALLLSVPVAFADCANAGDDVLGHIRQSGTLRVATTGDYRPFSFQAPDGTRAGIDVDVAQALAAELGVKLEWIDTTWPTLLGDLANQRYDIAMSGISMTPERAAAGCLSAPYFTTGKTILARCELKQRYTTLDQLNQPAATVIVNPGGTNEQFVRTHLPRAHVIVNPDNRSIFAALAAGAADVMITDAVEAQLEAAAHPQLCLPTDTIFERVDKVYLMPPDQAWRKWIDAWLERLHASGRFDAIASGHLRSRQSAPNPT